MARFYVDFRDIPDLEVEAPNVLMALGMALDRIGESGSLQYLRVEVTAEGVLLARERDTGGVIRVAPVDELQAISVDDMVVEEVTDHSLPDTDAELDIDVEDIWDMSGTEAVTEEVEMLDGSLLDEIPEAESPAYVNVTDLLDEVRRTATPQEAWIRALQLAHQLIPCESASGIAREENQMRFAAATGPQAGKVINLQIPLGKGISGFVTERMMSLVIRDPRADPRFYRSIDLITGYQTQSMLCVPIVSGGMPLGCLQLLNAQAGHEFTDVDLELLEQIGGALADRIA